MTVSVSFAWLKHKFGSIDSLWKKYLLHPLRINRRSVFLAFNCKFEVTDITS